MQLRPDHLNIVVTDLPSSLKFFELLGFEKNVESELDPGFLEQLTGIAKAKGRFVAIKHPSSELVIELLKYETAEGTRDPEIGKANQIGFRHLAFEVSDIDEVVTRLSAAGVEFLSSVLTWTKTGKRLVYFLGPDGILMELAQYPK